MAVGRDAAASAAAAGGETELGPDLGQAALGLAVAGRRLDLEHPALDRGLGELGHALGLGVAGLDLVADLVEGGDVLADRLRQRGHRLVHLLLHLRLVELAEEALALGELLLQGGGVLLDGGLGLIGGLGRPAGAGVLSSSISASRAMRRLANASAAVVYSVALVASPFLVASSAMSTAWRALPLTFSSSSMRPVQPQLGLLLVGDDVGGLLLEPAVLLLRLGDRLLELDLRIGLLVERRVELGRRGTSRTAGWP